MAVTPSDLAAYCSKPTEEALFERPLKVAKALLGEALEDAFRQPSEDVLDEMTLSVGKAVHERGKTSAGGAAQLTVVQGGVPVRAPRDPLASVRSMLANYVAGIA